MWQNKSISIDCKQQSVSFGDVFNVDLWIILHYTLLGQLGLQFCIYKAGYNTMNPSFLAMTAPTNWDRRRILLAASILVANVLFEEVVFRWVLFDWSTAVFGRRTVRTASSILFGLFHLFNWQMFTPLGVAFHVCNAAVFGYMLSVIAPDVIATFVMHLYVNVVLVVVMLVLGRRSTSSQPGGGGDGSGAAMKHEDLTVIIRSRRRSLGDHHATGFSTPIKFTMMRDARHVICPTALADHHRMCEALIFAEAERNVQKRLDELLLTVTRR